ncbi:hypothetical protein HDV57DRAFT_411552 [Trichoderma longibrachiatum]|uniref:Uncharacterized protein n=1 Tax=Trichoderma longibrachiatum ATCC 18648 TaxID=983965 RepID=A0A2T4C2J3_TRILO|nr:hypothetical protein M440DRAFT_1260912 [Trichoderma longibrachiatum ATCC 18648]
MWKINKPPSCTSLDARVQPLRQPSIHFLSKYHRVAFRRRLVLLPNDHRLRWATRHKRSCHHYYNCYPAKATGMTLCRETPATAHARPRNYHMCECHRHAPGMYGVLRDTDKHHFRWLGRLVWAMEKEAIISLYSNSARRVRMARHIFRIRRIEARLANCLASGLKSAPFSVWTLLFVALRWQQKGPCNTVDKKQPITVHAIMLVMHRPGLDL